MAVDYTTSHQKSPLWKKGRGRKEHAMGFFVFQLTPEATCFDIKDRYILVYFHTAKMLLTAI